MLVWIRRQLEKALLSRLSRDNRGVTAVEFGLVIGPFLIFAIAIVDLGLIYYAHTQIEAAVFETQEAIKSPANRPTSASEVKTRLCATGSMVMNCNKTGFFVEVQTLNGASPTSADPIQDTFSVTADAPAIIRVVYPWSNILPVHTLRFIGIDLSSIKIRAGSFFHMPRV